MHYAGWISVWFSQDDDEMYTTDGEQRIAQEITNFISSQLLGSGIRESKWVNGEFLIVLSGCPNRGTETLKILLQLFKYVGKKAPASYGLLYVNDHEDQDENQSNAYQIYALRRGRLSEHKDQILSPIVPVLFDA